MPIYTFSEEKNLKLVEERNISFDEVIGAIEDNQIKEKLSARKIAANTLRKDVRINIRLTSNDLSSIKQLAAHERLPYQTLIASILHKYAAGYLR